MVRPIITREKLQIMMANAIIAAISIFFITKKLIYTNV
jgi:hypothetical protein